MEELKDKKINLDALDWAVWTTGERRPCCLSCSERSVLQVLRVAMSREGKGVHSMYRNCRSKLRKWMKGHPRSGEERETWRGERETSQVSNTSTPSSVYQPSRFLVTQAAFKHLEKKMDQC